MVRRRELPALPDTGGQGRRLLFDAQAVAEYSKHSDFAAVLARARHACWLTLAENSERQRLHNEGKLSPDIPVLQFNRIAMGADHYWIKWESWPDRKPVHFGLEAFDGKFRCGNVPDEVSQWAKDICGLLSKRECEFLIAAFIVMGRRDHYGPAMKTLSNDKWTALLKFLKLFDHAANTAGLPSKRRALYTADLLSLGREISGTSEPDLQRLRDFLDKYHAAGDSADLIFKELKRRYALKHSHNFPAIVTVGSVMNTKPAQAHALFKSIKCKLSARPDLLLNFIILKPRQYLISSKDVAAMRRKRAQGSKRVSGKQCRCGAVQDENRASCPHCGAFYESHQTLKKNARGTWLQDNSSP